MLPPLKSDSVLRARYRIIRSIGQGGMGSLYYAEDLRLEGRFCAIKEILIDPNSTADQHEQARTQFHREASTLARLDHPNLPKVSDFFNDEDRDFLVMDYIPGVDLRQKIEEAAKKNQFIDEHQILDWASQLFGALTYLHSQTPPVVHRDIKPANIKLTPDGLIKLVDFGLVKLLTPNEDRTITVVQGRGTAHYTPLEQYGGDAGHTDARTDLYSVGATLYHLFTNEAPTEAKVRFLHPNSLVSPREINPQISQRTEQSILWAMEMHPEDRPESIEKLREVMLSTGPLGRWTAPAGRERLTRVAPVNRILLFSTIAMLVLSLLTTLFSPIIP